MMHKFCLFINWRKNKRWSQTFLQMSLTAITFCIPSAWYNARSTVDEHNKGLERLLAEKTSLWARSRHQCQPSLSWKPHRTLQCTQAGTAPSGGALGLMHRTLYLEETLE